ncbi:MAG: DUF488 domain-containing protein, partial [Clostridia bacterium]
FIQLMKTNKIDLVLDVREIPLSRKKGFSKSALSYCLQEYGIDYVHMKGLGSPKSIRDELHRTKDYSAFFHDYRWYVGRNFSYIQEAWEYVIDERTCLLCYESNYSECHRSIIAEILQNRMPYIDGVVNL